uniref:Bm566 n=1 Tax=Brugia malayi TaxID=6279 RepID=A0A0J9XXY1_BRUMA|nr:Bm566 [Brugia malayi]
MTERSGSDGFMSIGNRTMHQSYAYVRFSTTYLNIYRSEFLENNVPPTYNEKIYIS